jgi:hypothetical protein
MTRLVSRYLIVDSRRNSAALGDEVRDRQMLLSRRGIIQTGIATGASTIGATQLVGAANSEGARNDTGFVSVKTFGAVGDGAADDTEAIQMAVNECFGKTANPNSSGNAHRNKPLYFPPGIYKTTATIELTNVRGGHIFGAGRFTTTINNIAGTSVFRTNGFEYSRVEMMMLTTAEHRADIFDLDWTNTGGTALQSNTFADISFEGGAVGVNIGKSDFMGSENLFINCFFARCAVAGVKTSNYNALQNTLIGGNIQSWALGLWVSAGSCSVYNTGFQNGNAFDIVVNNSANDTMVVSGVRSESVNFVQLRNGITAHIVGCSHLNINSNGIFADIAGGSRAVIDSCVSLRGIITGNGNIKTSNSSFGRSDWIDVTSIWEGFHDVENCYAGGTPNTGANAAKFIGRKKITSTGTEWPSVRRLIAIPAGSNKSVLPIAAGTRIQRVTLVLDRPGSAGAIHVGDSSSPTRYFNAVELIGNSVISSTIECKYVTADTLIVQCNGAVSVEGSVMVDMILES